MTLQLSGETLHLGRDLPGGFPRPLGQIANAKLKELLARIDPTPDSVAESGARDWANFDDRMHFIADFFRCYHERSTLFDPPFTDEQVVELRAGRKPAGPLEECSRRRATRVRRGRRAPQPNQSTVRSSRLWTCDLLVCSCDEDLRFIARELLKTIRNNVRIDWIAYTSTACTTSPCTSVRR